MESINVGEIGFYIGIWVAASASSSLRCLRNGSFKSNYHLLCVSLCGGITASAILGYQLRNIGVPDYPLAYIAIAGGIGLVGKEAEKLLRYLVTSRMPEPKTTESTIDEN